jgi:uncharacterized protein involved in exopolysaccharide biosynthesis
MTRNQNLHKEIATDDDVAGISIGELVGVLRERLWLLLLAPLAAGLLAFTGTMLVPPTYTAVMIFMPPQQTQSSAASALASLGSLAGLAGGAAGISSPGERYVALMQSVTVSDRLIEQFKLMDVYDTKFRIDARKSLAGNVRIALGKKDGLITVEVDDTSQERAAAVANQYVDELRRITGTLAMTEAQQRRAFFERQLQQSRDSLARAQQGLQSSGFNATALKAEPKAAAEIYGRLKAETTAADMRLQILRGGLADNTPEVRQQQTTLAALREQLALAERTTNTSTDQDYVSKYREFKYQETLFELYARQFELARADESREGALFQVIDPATAPERTSKPKRALISLSATVVVGLVLAMWIVWREYLDRRGQSEADLAIAKI